VISIIAELKHKSTNIF